MSTAFDRFAAAKERMATRARIDALRTEVDHAAGRPLLAIGNDWTRRMYDGNFYLFGAAPAMPAVSAVFVQSVDGNTGAENPSDLGGGDTDLHLVYEGVSRVAADAVLAGANTVRGDVLFSVWHPEFVSLRTHLKLPRHPAQIVTTRDGNLDLDQDLLFNVPEIPVFIIAGASARARLRHGLSERPWITVIPMDYDNLLPAFHDLYVHGIRRISAVGGRTIASSLMDAGLVQDLCLTTTSTPGGTPGTPFYVGSRMPHWELLTRKLSAPAAGPGIRVEQLGLALRS